MEIMQIPTDVIKPYFRNPRVNTKTVEALVKIIPQVGFNVPLVVDKDYVIIKGHARWKAGRILKMDALPCIVSKNDDEVNRLDRLADNKIPELSEWDIEDLEFEMSGISIDMSDFGFDAIESSIGWIDEPVFVESTSDGMGVANVSATPSSIQRAEEVHKSTGDDPIIYLSLKCPECGHEYKLSRTEIERLLG